MSEQARQPIVFADPDEIVYDLKGRLIPIEDLTDRQLRRAWHETVKQMGKISEEVLDLEQKHHRRFQILERISKVTKERNLDPLPRVLIVNKPVLEDQ